MSGSFSLRWLEDRFLLSGIAYRASVPLVASYRLIKDLAHSFCGHAAFLRFVNKSLHRRDLVRALLISPDKIADIVARIAVAAL